MSDRSVRVCLGLLVFWSGLVTLSVELSASRLLAPYFGTSLIVWTNLIGLILIYLAAGYWLGGRLADRVPHVSALLAITAAAGLSVALVPVVALPVLRAAVGAFAGLQVGLLVGSFVGVLAIFALPMVLLGGVSPFAVRLATSRVEHAGRVAGRIYALSTLGSFVGTFLPVLVLIPAMGTRRTFLLLGLSLVAVSAAGFVVVRRWAFAGLALGLAAVAWWVWAQVVPGAPLKPGENVLYEGESAYQYIRVVETLEGERLLEFNEGVGVHSRYNPRTPYTGRVWDFFALAPLFNPAPYDPFEEAQRWALVGAAAGTAARVITAIYGPVPIEGVELDPRVLEVGRQYFDMNLPNVRLTAIDGRAWLLLDQGVYDVIIVDAYRQPYIPFELTTVEFFGLVKDHLTEDGVVVVNANRGLNGDRRLVRALAATMRRVYPAVFTVDIDVSFNTLVVATRAPSTPADFQANAARVAHPVMRSLAERAVQGLRVWDQEGGPVLTDDRAPVEWLTDLMIVEAALRGGEQTP
ncbi:MAG: fused MFS/spermidine synthase [Ardenticatenia bacterium]|nr:fused MFS/spermidine synthase [Ardenticatenia bacterium]